MNAFWPWQKQNSDFQFLAFPIGCVGGLRWRWGLKTNFEIFLKCIFVQEGSSGSRFDHGRFEIKTFPIYAPPYCISFVYSIQVFKSSFKAEKLQQIGRCRYHLYWGIQITIVHCASRQYKPECNNNKNIWIIKVVMQNRCATCLWI